MGRGRSGHRPRVPSRATRRDKSAPSKLARIRPAVSRSHELSEVYGSIATTTRWNIVVHPSIVRGSPPMGSSSMSGETVATARKGSGAPVPGSRSAAWPDLAPRPVGVHSPGAPDRAPALRRPLPGRAGVAAGAGVRRCARGVLGRPGRARRRVPSHHRPPAYLWAALVALAPACCVPHRPADRGPGVRRPDGRRPDPPPSRPRAARRTPTVVVVGWPDQAMSALARAG